MTDLEQRADRVRQIATSLYGNVLDRDGDTMVIEVPPDLLGGAFCLLGQRGFVFKIGKQSTKMSRRRVVSTQAQTIACDDKVTTRFFLDQYRSSAAHSCRRNAAARGRHRGDKAGKAMTTAGYQPKNRPIASGNLKRSSKSLPVVRMTRSQ
jgi:hypothetical protein